MQPNPAEIADAFLQKPLDIAALCATLETPTQVAPPRPHALRRVKHHNLKLRV
jgi:hypothetical protein